VPNETNDWNAYSTARPVIHRRRGPTQDGRIGSTALPGPGGDALALANVVVSGALNNGDAVYGLDKLYGDGIHDHDGSDLAIMPAVDAKLYNLSHFDNSDIWFKASNDLNVKTGWLGRWIDRNGSDLNPLQAVSIDWSLSKAIRTVDKPVCVMPTLDGLGFSLDATQSYGGVWTPTATVTGQVDQLAGVPATAGNDHLARTRLAYHLAHDVWQSGNQLAGQPLGTGYPNGWLSEQLKLAALLLGANLGTRIITIHWGSFDTHGDQLENHDPQLSTLSRALSSFKADLAARGVEQDVTTLVFSEFGRRVEENGGGTDHGAGGLMMMMGSAVKGGWAAEFPGCASSAGLDDGNLKVATDFRSVYQAVIDEWLGDDPAAILPGGPFPDLSRPDGLSGLIG
jgi:uncharacterized protein (DUF1501 family)